MGIYISVLFTSFFAFLILGVPISVGIGLSSLLTMVSILPLNQAVFTAAQKAFSGIDSFALLAIPFFTLAGNIMNRGGIARRLIDLAKVMAGRIPGVLAQSNVIANMFFGAISGSSIAAATAIGGIMAPLEEEEGYDKAFSAAVNISSAPSGILIPPSGPLILYSLTTGGAVSVAALFMGGYIPGLMMGLGCMIVAYFFAKKHNYRVSERKSAKEKFEVFVNAIPSLGLIVVVIGGIVAGVFTPTEGAAISVVYALILSLFYRTLKLSDLPAILSETAVGTATILFLIAASGIMSWAMTFTGIPRTVSDIVMGISDNKIVIMLFINLILLIVGTFMDLTPAVLIFTPIFLPIITQLGIHPVHFGLIMIFNLGIGNMTPPVGSVLFVGCKVGKVTLEAVAPKLIQFFIADVVMLMLVTFVPALSLALPRWTGLL